MTRSDLLGTLQTVVLLSTAAGVALGLRAPKEDAPSTAEKRPSALLAAVTHPLAQFLFVCAIVFVNQVLFDAYVLKVHHGDPSFVGRYIGRGWFAIAHDDALVRFAIAHVGDGRWLSFTVLRAQAFLELPWTIFAYLTVARMLGPSVLRRLVSPPLLVAACVSFSVTFSLVELWLPNPWTRDDLWLRAISAIVTPLWVLFVTRAHFRASTLVDAPRGLFGLLAFIAGAGAIAFVVLSLYDAFLLYNLAHLGSYAHGLAVAIALAAVASYTSPRIDAWIGKKLDVPPSRAMAAAYEPLASFTLLFFVPSLALRYGAMLGVSLACGLGLVGFAFARGLRRALDGAKASDVARVGVALVAATIVGLVAGALAIAASRNAPLPELVLARASVAFLAVAFVAMRVTERVLRVCFPPHEEEAQVDEA